MPLNKETKLNLSGFMLNCMWWKIYEKLWETKVNQVFEFANFWNFVVNEYAILFCCR